ncbi:MAG: FAD-binding oxidoreductase [Granulosicoccus sp.]
MNRYRSWGWTPPTTPSVTVPTNANGVLHLLPGYGSTRLGFGNGRSYGDSCLNSAGELIDTQALDRLIEFDEHNGLLSAEAGITFSAILAVIVPKGWFLPVSPGTSRITLGGAIANDVHGKNHHADGSFGRFIEQMTLHRSDGSVSILSPTANSELFAATIGGLGLTGLISQATIRLIPISSAELDVHTEVFYGLDEFCDLSARFRDSHQYTVSWLDCASSGRQFARGVFLAANHGTTGSLEAPSLKARFTMPFALPAQLLNRTTVRAFNTLYFHRHRPATGSVQRQSYPTFFYPLDGIEHWNRLYGRQGFHQFQFVVPSSEISNLEAILRRIVNSGMGSFLAVLKEFGDIPSPGLLSFPRPGLCLALDFAARGHKTTALVHELNETVLAAGGAVYPAKDRLMSASSFRQYFPAMDAFSRHVDPGFSSDFWRRVST